MKVSYDQTINLISNGGKLSIQFLHLEKSTQRKSDW